MLLEKAQRAFDSNRDPVWDSWKEQAEGWISVGEYVGAAEKAEFLNTPSLPVPSYSDADCIRWSAKCPTTKPFCGESLSIFRSAVSRSPGPTWPD